MPDQYYQVAMNDSWRWAKVDFFVDHAHHPWSSLLYSTIVLYDKVSETINIFQSYRGYAYKALEGTLFATDMVAACHSWKLLDSLFKNAWISARWSTRLDSHHIPHTGTWLRGEHSGKCCSIYILQIYHAPGHKLMKTLPISEDDATVTILTITRNY